MKVVSLVSWTVLRDRFREETSCSKAWFNQNVQKIKKKVIMNVQLKTFSSILLFCVVKNSPFWTKGCLTSNQGCLQWPWFEVTQPSIQKGEFPTTVEWVVFFAMSVPRHCWQPCFLYITSVSGLGTKFAQCAPMWMHILTRYKMQAGPRSSRRHRRCARRNCRITYCWWSKFNNVCIK